MIEKINENRESQILEAAKNIFTRKGYDGTSMQEIADQANISKSMLHYYFRSKDKLFEKIFSETFNKFLSQIALFLSEDIGIVEKIKMFISKHIDFISQNSSMPYFILNEINRNPSKIIKMMSSVFEKERTLLSFFSQIENEIKLGNIKPIDPKHLFINILSMNVFPFVAKPLIKGLFRFDDAHFDNFIQERKIVVYDTIINSIVEKK